MAVFDLVPFWVDGRSSVCGGDEMTHDKLVDKMLDAQDRSNRSDVWRTYCEEDKRRFRLAMSAALRVAVDELLKEPTKEETTKHFPTVSTWDVTTHNLAKSMLDARRAKLERPKTPEERVTVENTRQINADNFTHYIVQLDGVTKVEFLMLSDALIYRKGLIADLKEKEAAQ